MPAHVGTRLRHALIVGEAPGVNEDVTGSPFVGRAGGILMAAARAAGVTREDVTITNAVKCRPVDNRMPKDIEIDTCHTYLDQEIEEYGVTCILALGNAALFSLLGVVGVTSMRGEWYGDVLPTYHPSYVARQRTDSEVATQFRADVKEFLRRAIDTSH
jgi:DNA polymerase